MSKKKKAAKRRAFHRVTKEVIAMLEDKFPDEFMAIGFDVDMRTVVNDAPVFVIKVARPMVSKSKKV